MMIRPSQLLAAGDFFNLKGDMENEHGSNEV